MIPRQCILTIEEIVFVNLNAEGRPAAHGYDQITYERNRIPTHHTSKAPQGLGMMGRTEPLFDRGR